MSYLSLVFIVIALIMPNKFWEIVMKNTVKAIKKVLGLLKHKD